MYWAMGRPYLILGTMEDADALLQKRSSIYSNRPRLVMAAEIVRYVLLLS